MWAITSSNTETLGLRQPRGAEGRSTVENRGFSAGGFHLRICLDHAARAKNLVERCFTAGGTALLSSYDVFSFNEICGLAGRA